MLAVNLSWRNPSRDESSLLPRESGALHLFVAFEAQQLRNQPTRHQVQTWLDDPS